MQIISLANSNVELNGNLLTVYHRTKSQDVAGDICDTGFMAGSGAMYGVGIYSTYTLDSSLKNYNLSSYGGQLLKAQVNIDKFIICDYALSKTVYGSNYKLIDQIKNVIGLDFLLDQSSYEDRLSELEGYSEKLNNTEYSSDIALLISNRFRLDSSGVNGIIYTGRNDGNVCLSYKESLITPVAHAWVDGRTYKNPKWEPCDQRSVEELRDIAQNESKLKAFRDERRKLKLYLSNHSNTGEINVNRSNYPNLSDNIFDSIIFNFLYEDFNRINRLNSDLKFKMQSVFYSEYMIKRLKSAPTVYWKQFESLDQDIREKIPKEVLTDIWEQFILENPGYWNQIPDQIRNSIPKDNEAEHWVKLIKKNPRNWEFVHPEIADYIKDNFNLESNYVKTSNNSKNELNVADTIEVPSASLGWINENIKKMNQRAGKLGLPPIQHEVISENTKTRTQTIKIVGNVPYMKGWKLIARISRVQDDSGKPFNMVETLSDEGLPSSINIESIDMRCDDCGYNRQRKECFLIKNESATEPHGVKKKIWDIGSYLVIGSSCLQDFIADIDSKISPQNVAKYAENFQQMLTLFKEGDQYKDKSFSDITKHFKTKGVPIVFFLSKVMQLNNSLGFKGRKEVYSQGGTATADLAWSMCVDLDADKQYSTDVSASDLSFIYNALAWISSNEDASDPSNKFLYNLKTNCQSGIVFNKRSSSNAGIVSWLPIAYDRFLNDKQNDGRNVDKKQIIGLKNDKIVFHGLVTCKKPVLIQLSQQSTNNTNLMKNYNVAKSQDNKEVIWLESYPINADVNQSIHIEGTVEGHTFLDGHWSTVLKDVKEISSEQFSSEQKQTEQRMIELQKQEDAEKKPELNEEYFHGAKVVNDFTIISKRNINANKILYLLQDSNNKKLSTFTNLNLGDVNDKIKLSGNISINGIYVNLVNVEMVDSSLSNTVQVDNSFKDYKDGDIIEDEFTIDSISSAQYYGKSLYNLRDKNDRKISLFHKDLLGKVGEKIRIKGKVKLKGPYINLERVEVMQNSSSNNTMQDSSVSALTKNWYSLYKESALSLNPYNWFNDKNEKKDKQPENKDEVINKSKYSLPHEIDADKAYQMFSDSYEKNTGKSWDKSKFLQRSGNWIFFGDDNGYIAVRPQRSGLYKLVAIAGNEENPIAKGKSLLKAFNDLMSSGKPVWGMVSDEIKNIAERMGMKSPPASFVHNFIKYIPSQVLGNAQIKNLLSDGGIVLDYSDVGSTSKYFIANEAYFDWLRQNIDSNESIPKSIKFILKGFLHKMSFTHDDKMFKESSFDNLILVQNHFDF